MSYSLHDYPLVTIVTPTYNSEKWIEKCLQSVADQDYPEIEHIIVDAASVDKTLDICSKFPGVTVLSEHDRGQSHAINKGFAMAQGKILAWLCADDIYEKNAVSEAVKAILLGNSVVMGHSVFVDAEGKKLRDHPSKDVGDYTHSKFLKFWKYIPISQPATFWTREYWNLFGPLKETLNFAMDYDLWLRMSKGSDFIFFQKQIAKYTIHPEAKCFSDNYGSRIELIEVSQRYWPKWYKFSYWMLFLSYHLSNSSITKHYADAECYVEVAESLLKNNKLLSAWGRLARSLLIHPTSPFMKSYRKAVIKTVKKNISIFMPDKKNLDFEPGKNKHFDDDFLLHDCIKNNNESLNRFHNKEDSLRIALFCRSNETQGSGNERLVFKTARHLIAKGHDVRVYIKHPGSGDSRPFFVHRLMNFPFERYFEYGLRYVTGLNDVWHPSTLLFIFIPWISKADIWHFHNIHPHYISLPLLGIFSLKKNIVLSPVDQYLSTGHCPYSENCTGYKTGCSPCQRPDETYPGMVRDSAGLMWSLKRKVLQKGKFCMLFHTHALAGHYSRENIIENPTILHYGEDNNCYRPLPRDICANRLGLQAGNRITIGLLHSRIDDPRKGILTLVNRLNELAQDSTQALELIVVGRGSNKISDIVAPILKVTSIPYLQSETELSNALNLCDVLLYPTSAENLSLTTLAALACGVPVITYDAGGQKEAVLDGVNGFIVACGDSEKMIERLDEIIKDSTLRKRMSVAARQIALTDFDFDSYNQKLEKYYSKVLAR